MIMLRGFSSKIRPVERLIDPRGNLLDLLRENYIKRPDEMLMICPSGIGDTYFACGLVEHVLKKRNRKNLHVLCPAHQTFIPPAFNAKWKASTLPDWVDIRLLKEGGPLSENFLYAHFQTAESVNLLGYKGVTLLDAYKALFDLPQTTPLLRPKLITPDQRRRVRQFLSDHSLTPKKTAVLAPEAVSVGELGVGFWKDLSVKLKEKGWKVVLNSGKYKSQIPHDAICDVLGLEKFPALSEEIGAFIALRSGLADLLSDVDCRLIVIYPDVQWYAGTMYESTSLKAMGMSDSAKEIQFKSSKESSDYIIKSLTS